MENVEEIHEKPTDGNKNPDGDKKMSKGEVLWIQNRCLVIMARIKDTKLSKELGVVTYIKM